MRDKKLRKPIRWQKECLSAHYLRSDHWLIEEETGFYLKIVNKYTGVRKVVDKFKREKIK